MKIKYLAYLMFLPILFYTACETEDKITNPNTVEEFTASTPSMLADGISTTSLSIVISDTSGNPAADQKILFETTAGTITESAISNSSGKAVAILESIPSELDILVTVKATVLDSSSLQKRASIYSLSFEENTQEKTDLLPYEAEMDLLFIGVTHSIELEETELPADGASKGAIKVIVKETESKKAVPNAPLSVRSVHNTIPSEYSTNESGSAEIEFTTLTKALTDTFLIDYAQFATDTIEIEYIQPILRLSPDSAQIRTDGTSTVLFTAQITTGNNHPVSDVTVDFTTSHGIINKSAKTNNAGVASAILTGTTEAESDVQVIARFYDAADTAHVAFVDKVGNQTVSVTGPTELLRNGIETAQLRAVVMNQDGLPVEGEKVEFTSIYGKVDTVVYTDANGVALSNYLVDSDSSMVEEIIQVQAGAASATTAFPLQGITMLLSAVPDSVTADGQSTVQININLKRTFDFGAVPNAPLQFRSTLGSITPSASTDQYGFTQATLTSSQSAGVATVYVKYGMIEKSIQVKFISEQASSIILSAAPNFIWVKESGNTDQTIISAEVRSQTGKPVGSELEIMFYIRNGAGGGELLSPSEGISTQTTPIKTINGRAQATLKAGIRPGTIEIEARVVNNEQIKSSTTNIVIRSGPPYIYIDPDNPHNVEPHMTLTFDFFNLNGWNVVQKFKPSIYIGDKYNNPVELNTAVYLTTTGGIVSTDVLTDELGEAGAVLTTANPRPYVTPNDPMALSPHTIPNPNMAVDDPDRFIPITVPDFDAFNPHGVWGENDGIAYVLAATHGRDQNGNDAVVWTVGEVVFSGPLLVFHVSTDKDSLGHGQAAEITIEVTDINGNPLAAGSVLTASASKGKISTASLMAEPDRYGFGQTMFTTYLLNNLNPEEDEPEMAEVTVEVNSPNGKATGTVFIYLKI